MSQRGIIRDILDRPHRRRHTIHFHARRCGHCLDREHGIFAVGQKLQFAPARYYRSAQLQRAAQALGRIYHLLGGLSVNVKTFGGSENKISALVRGHRGFLQVVMQLSRRVPGRPAL